MFTTPNKTGRGNGLFKKFCHPNGFEWAALYGALGSAYIRSARACGSIPAATSLTLHCCAWAITSACPIARYSGTMDSLASSRSALGTILDSVGAVDIFDNCFIGYQSYHHAGRDHRSEFNRRRRCCCHRCSARCRGGGNPAKVLCTVEELIKKIEERCDDYPWMDTHPPARRRTSTRNLEPKLKAMRVQYFFGEKAND